INQMYLNTISIVLQHNKIFLIDSDGAKNIFYVLSDTQKQALLSNTQGGN
ncbi:FtsH protease activity modulator HflK, partial [Francisella tularensis subsp. holarctica]|nr:FtsH protease activity modulator HflK [Francisella tularensis subsp. holarctica]